MKSIEEILNSGERLPGKTQIDYKKAAAFKEACDILDGFKAKGVLTYKADDPREPLSYHAIQVKFNFESDYCQEFNAKEIAELLSKVDELLVDNEPVSGDWQLGSRLYGLKD